MQKVSIQWKGRCPRHPRFSGEAGLGAVKAGCPVCDALVSVAIAQTQLRMACQRADARAAEARALELAAAQRRARR